MTEEEQVTSVSSSPFYQYDLEGVGSVCFIPSRFFFIDSVDLPGEMSFEELGSFAEITLESISPFPLEKLLWGFVVRGEWLLVYAALKDRVTNQLSVELNDCAHVFPSFLPLCGKERPEREQLVLDEGDWETELFFPDEEALPQRISFSNCNEFEESRLSCSIEAPVMVKGGGIEFGYKEGTKTWKWLVASEEECWAADIRDEAFIISERNNRQLSKRLWSAAWVALLLGLICFFLELMMVGVSMSGEKKQALINQRANEVATIEKRRDLLTQLEVVTSGMLEPYRILNEINLLRPKSVYFRQLKSKERGAIIIEGETVRANDLNTYLDKLRSSGKFEFVSQDRIVRQGGILRFTVSIVVKEDMEDADV